MLLNASRVAKKVVKEAESNKELGLLFIPLAFETLNAGKTTDSMNKIIFEHAREQEAKEKEVMIKTDLENTRKKKDKIQVIDTTNGGLIDFDDVPRFLYLISYHSDSAKDHFLYQGHIYFDKQRKSLITDKRLKAIVQDYIAKNCPLSFQEVINKPIWMITRPNCRHYYLDVSLQEALTMNDSQLLKKYNMRKAIGQRGEYQTIYHSTRKQWYTKQNMQNIITKYKQRLDFHKKAQAISDNLEIQKLIKKDKLLIKKWTNYLQTF